MVLLDDLVWICVCGVALYLVRRRCLPLFFVFVVMFVLMEGLFFNYKYVVIVVVVVVVVDVVAIVALCRIFVLVFARVVVSPL